MKNDQDAYGRQLLAQYLNKEPTVEIIERDDFYIDTGSDAGLYFAEYEDWSPTEQRAIALAGDAVLDVGCGAGRHSLYLQNKGFDVTGIDNSPGAIEVCKSRGLKKALLRPIAEVDKFEPASFDTILMFGNNFGLFGDPETAKVILKKFHRITTENAQIIAGTRNPYQTANAEHFEYLEFNKNRGRMPGQIRIRIRFGKTVGEWFDYLFVSPEEMREILKDTDWQITEFIAPEQSNYFAVIGKNSL